MKFKEIKTTMLIAIILTLVLSTFKFGQGLDMDPIEVDNEINNLAASISNLDNEIMECENNKSNAHTMADAARQLNFDEGHEIIQTAKEIYSENGITLEQLKAEKTTLENRKLDLESSQKYIGTFKLTGYCPCSICCGKWANGITASGKKAVEGITVAADPRVIPLGTRVYIEGLGERVVQDTGGAIKNNKIDVYVSYHNKAYNAAYNQSAARVWILK